MPKREAAASKRGRFAETAIGFVRVDACELRLAEGKRHMFLAVDRLTKSTYVEFHERSNMAIGADFLHVALDAFPYKMRIALTDNGIAFADAPQNRGGCTDHYRGHSFDQVRQENGIEHSVTKPYHPWTTGQAERMNRTVKALHYPGLDALRAHVLAFVRAHNFAKHLNALRWRTPFQAVCDAWAQEPSNFTINPHHLIPGPNTQ